MGGGKIWSAGDLKIAVEISVLVLVVLVVEVAKESE